MKFLRPGELYFGNSEEKLGTVLGSCVAIILWHPSLKYTGFCHFVLPFKAYGKANSGNYRKPSGFYGDDAVSTLVTKAKNAGTDIGDYETKVFGGSNALQLPELAGLPSVGQRNIEAAFEWVEDYGMRLISSDVGGEGSRRITFDPETGSVWVRHLKSY
jgi:chemotaxis protein CheD